MEMRSEQRRFEITELAPDVTLEEVLDKTSGEVLVAEPLGSS
jgi:acyl CoA:acetate/3-ketoacid CoA transferase beta subunit